jgi:hypothetical protein
MRGSARISIAGFSAGLLLVGLAFATPLCAQSITYVLAVHRMNAQASFASGGPSGTVNGIPFGANNNAVMTFVFHGDASTVVPWAFGGSSGYENVTGTASFQINDSATGASIARGTFLPSAGIYVSTDTQFGGVGFGSGGGLPGSPQFPGNPLYPYGFVVSNTYDLSSPTTLGPLNSSYSCINFPFVCTAPTPLATSAGNLIINSSDGQVGFFAAIDGTATPFTNFRSVASVDASSGNFSITGRFRPARGNPIDPVNQPVSFHLQVLMYDLLSSLSVSLPPGSFRQVSEDPVYEYSGALAGGNITVFIRSGEDNSFSFRASGTTTDLLFPYFAITPYPDAFFLSIGNSIGETVPAN